MVGKVFLGKNWLVVSISNVRLFPSGFPDGRSPSPTKRSCSWGCSWFISDLTSGPPSWANYRFVDYVGYGCFQKSLVVNLQVGARSLTLPVSNDWQVGTAAGWLFFQRVDPPAV